jgi:hypothetical protein
VEFARTFVRPNTLDSCRLTERFLPAETSVRWEIEILGYGLPWSTEIETQFAWLESPTAQFWTVWGQPPGDARHWRDPLIFAKFADRT